MQFRLQQKATVEDKARNGEKLASEVSAMDGTTLEGLFEWQDGMPVWFLVKT